MSNTLPSPPEDNKENATLRAYIVELKHENDLLKQSQQAQIESSEGLQTTKTEVISVLGSLQHIYTKVPLGLCCLDKNLRYVFVNEWLAALNGLSVEQHLGRSISEVLPDVAAGVEEELCQVIETGIPIVGRAVVAETAAHPGAKKYFEHHYDAVRSTDGTIVGVSCVVQDVTARKQAELSMQDSEERMSLALDAVGGGVFDWDIANDVWTRSDSWYELLGYDRDELVRFEEEHGSIIHPDDYKGMEIAFKAHVRGERDRYRYEFRIHHKSGEWRWFLGQGLIVDRAENGSPLRMVGTDSDITERKRSEEALQKAHEGLEDKVRERTKELQSTNETLQLTQFSVDGASESIFWIGPDSRIRNVNEAACKTLGYSHQELLSMTIHDIDPNFSREDWGRAWEELRSSGAGEFETTLRKKDGRMIAIEIVENYVNFGDKEYSVAFARDITTRKLAEEALREREELYRNAIAAADSVVYQKEYAGNTYTHMGSMITDLIGYEVDELTPELWFKIVTQVEMHGPARGKSQSELRRLFRNGELPVWQGDYKCTTKNGETRWLNDSAVPIHNRAGNVVGCLGVLQNITDRKLAEERLRQSEERFALALEATSECVWDWNIASGEMYFNLQWFRVLGFNPSEVEPSVRFWDSLVHPEDMPRIMEALNAHYQGKTEAYECEVRLRAKSGEYIWILDRGKVVARDENGKPLRMVGVNVDITERKLAEKALRLSEERLMSALVASQTGTWRVDLRTGFDTRDASLNQLLGLSAEPSTQPVEDWFSYVHPDDADAMNLAWQRGLESGMYSVEHRLIRCDGQVLWVFDRGMIFRDDKGKLDHAIGAVMDITERKQAEESRAILSRELDHRVKNNLSSVIALAQLTAQSTDSIQDFVKLFTNRITSLARVHETLASKKWQGIDLEELMLLALGPFHACGSRLRLSGPAVIVPASNVQPLALAIYELISNAAQHGSFSSEDGIVEVKWQRDAQHMVIEWSEHGGPLIENPLEFGVGLRLVRGLVEKEIGGNLKVDFDAKGFQCVIQMPVPLAESSLGDET